MKEYKKIILTKPKIMVDTCCPKCKSYDVIALHEISVSCNNCKTNFSSSLGMNIYQSIAKQITMNLANGNGTYIVGERMDSKVFHSEDILKPRTQMEDAIWHAMCAIQKHYQKHKCWEVSKITNEYDVDYKIQCKDCGYCKNCVTCTKCREKYVPKDINVGTRKEQRYTCPKCNSKGYNDTVITKFKKGQHGDECPYCKSTNVVNARFTSDRKKCPKCKSINLTEPRKIPIYRMLIERQKRFWIDE